MKNEIAAQCYSQGINQQKVSGFFEILIGYLDIDVESLSSKKYLRRVAYVLDSAVVIERDGESGERKT